MAPASIEDMAAAATIRAFHERTTLRGRPTAGPSFATALDSVAFEQLPCCRARSAEDLGEEVVEKVAFAARVMS